MELHSKKKLGANAMLGVSLACARAAADYYGLPLYKYLGGPNAKKLPVPMMNVINGGSHADSSVDFQEFMIMPVGAPSLHEALRWGAEVFHELKKVLKEKGHITAVGDEGGFAPNLATNEEPLEVIMQAIKRAGYKPGVDFMLALDVAASEFFDKKKNIYDLKKSGQGHKTADEMIAWYVAMVDKYPIISIEDGLAEGDWDGWKRLTDALGKKFNSLVMIYSLLTLQSLKKELTEALPTQFSLRSTKLAPFTETLDAMEMAERAGYTCVVSHRSGETEDTTIADLAVAFKCWPN